jgi:hypothetical protein
LLSGIKVAFNERSKIKRQASTNQTSTIKGFKQKTLKMNGNKKGENIIK